MTDKKPGNTSQKPETRGQNGVSGKGSSARLRNNQAVTHSFVRKATKIAFAPELGRSLESIKFAWHLLVNLVAQLFVMVDLIPKDHPSADLRNAKDYKLLSIINIAYKNVLWDREHIPQMVMFFAVISLLFFVALSTITLVLNLGVNAAHADTGDGNSVNDVLNQIFNLSGTNALPTAFGAMLAVYSNMVLVLAGIILIYTIIHFVVESARHGQAGGKSFNHGWAPVRLVFALGLLIPLSSGLNSGQYITLYLAKWGSDVATNVYKHFTSAIGMGEGITQAHLSGQPQEALEDAFNLFVCAYKANDKEHGHINIPTTMTKVEPLNPLDHTYEMNFDIADQTQGDKKGCGKISFYYNDFPSGAAGEEDAQLLSQQFIWFSSNIPQISQYARQYANYLNPQSTNYFQNIPVSNLKNEIETLAGNYKTTIENGAAAAVNQANIDIANEMNQDLSSLGWVSAPMWIHRIADRNADMTNAQLSLPKTEYYGDDVARSLTHGAELNNGNNSVDSTPGLMMFKDKIAQIFGGTTSFGADMENSLVAQTGNPLSAIISQGYLLFTATVAVWVGWIVIAGAAGFGATVGTGAVEAANIIINGLVGMMFASAIMMGFILPLIPTIRFIFAVLGWIVIVIVGVMGMPLFALAHLKTGGEGWIGQLQVASAYNMLTGIIIRPTLIVLGLVASIELFNIFAHLAGTLMMGGINDFNGSQVGSYANESLSVTGLVPIIMSIIKTSILATFLVTLANACFKLIDVVPSQAMTWMGTGPMSSPIEDGTGEVTNEVKSTGNQIQQTLTGGAKAGALAFHKWSEGTKTPVEAGSEPEPSNKKSRHKPMNKPKTSEADNANSLQITAGDGPGSRTGGDLGPAPASPGTQQIRGITDDGNAVTSEGRQLGINGRERIDAAPPTPPPNPDSPGSTPTGDGGDNA